MHFDLRLQVGDKFRSWAVPRGPSLDPAVARLAIRVEDHGLGAGDFEGVHHGAIRGSGAVIIWDEGLIESLDEGPKHVSFSLVGSKLRGRFGLTVTDKGQWLLVKADDEFARRGSDIVAEKPASVRSGMTWQQIAADDL